MTSFLFIPKERIFFKTCFILGLSRVGKTLLGNIISTSSQVEYMEEPWLLNVMTFFERNVVSDKELFIQAVRGFLFFSFNESFLLRNANFRKIDLSYIGMKKTPDEIQFRLNSVKNIVDTEKAAINPLFVLNAPGICGSFDIYRRVVPDCIIINVIRHPLAVAASIKQKEWFSNENLKKPSSGEPVYYSERYQLFLPWWVKKEDEDFFFNLSLFDRGIYYWCINFDELKKQKTDDIVTIKYEDIVDKPFDMVQKIFSLLGISMREMTLQKISQIKKIPLGIEFIQDKGLQLWCKKLIRDNKLEYEI